MNRTVVDAVEFTPGVKGVRTSTRKGTSAEGLPSFRGEGKESNNWIVDSLAISPLADTPIRDHFPEMILF